MLAGNLEYLMSSLPYLTFKGNDEHRSQVKDILNKYAGDSLADGSLSSILDEEASKFLSPQNAHLFQSIQQPTIHEEQFRTSEQPVLAAYASFSYSLKNQIKQLRVARKEKSETGRLEQSLSLTPGNPLEEELQLLELQWKKLELLSTGHHADFGALLIYKMKLQVLERYWSFDSRIGYDVFLKTTQKD